VLLYIVAEKKQLKINSLTYR